MIVGRNGLGLFRIAPPAPLMISLGTIGPLVACFVTHRLETGNWQAVRLFPHGKLALLWLILGPVLVLFCVFVIFTALISRGSPEAWRWHPAVLSGILVPMFNYNLFGGPLFEEFGWRGFLQSRMQDALSPWVAAICVGVMWAGWHLPLFLVHGFSSASPVVFLAILIGLSTVMAFAFNASGKAVVVTILMHSAFNSSPRRIDSYLRGDPTRSHPSPELLLAAAFLFVAFVLVIMTNGRLAASKVRTRCSSSLGLQTSGQSKNVD
jgi:membrane protease YdiL (CAAX protease family)